MTPKQKREYKAANQIRKRNLLINNSGDSGYSGTIQGLDGHVPNKQRRLNPLKSGA